MPARIFTSYSRLMTFSLVLMLGAQAYFIYKLYRFYTPPTADDYSTTRGSLTTFCVFSLILLFATFAVGVRCFLDFDKGLRQSKTFGSEPSFHPTLEGYSLTLLDLLKRSFGRSKWLNIQEWQLRRWSSRNGAAGFILFCGRGSAPTADFNRVITPKTSLHLLSCMRLAMDSLFVRLIIIRSCAITEYWFCFYGSPTLAWTFDCRRG